MSDRTRIQRALERGDVRAHEWASLPTPDGVAKPILRVGARIEELRRQGVQILTVEKRPSALYRLQSSPASPSHARDGVTAGGAKLGAEPLPPLGSAPEHATRLGGPQTPPSAAPGALTPRSAGERAGVDRRLTTGQRDTTGPGSLVAPEGPSAPLVTPLGPAEEHAQAGIAAGLSGLHPERGSSPYADDDDLGWIADRYDDGKAAA